MCVYLSLSLHDWSKNYQEHVLEVNAVPIIEPSHSTQSSTKVLGRKAMERLDLLLLAVEALDLHGSQAMIWSTSRLGLSNLFPNRVALWKSRCYNPIRKAPRRGNLNFDNSEGLMLLLCSMSERVYPLIRQLLSSKEPSEITQQRWEVFDCRMKELISERMNTRRSRVKRLLENDSEFSLYRDLLFTLALCVGPNGLSRLRASLSDPSI